MFTKSFSVATDDDFKGRSARVSIKYNSVLLVLAYTDVLLRSGLHGCY